MSEQDIPDWLKAMRPDSPPPDEQSDIPDWLKAMRPQEAGGAPPEPVEESAPPESAVEAAPASPPSEFDVLREKVAATSQMELEPESPLKRSPIFQVIHSLKPQQRFLLSLLIFMNVSTLGCFLLLVLGRIALAR